MKRPMPRRTLQLALMLITVTLVGLPTHAYGQPPAQIPGDPLGSFESPGPPAPLNWTGDGQRIPNSSFETGLSPWVQVSANAAAGSNIVLQGTGYDGSSSVLLSLRSGNATENSLLSLVNDLTSQQVGFSASVRLRAAVYVENITGATSFDRVEVSISLTNSTGFVRVIHYVFAGGPLPPNSQSDGYFSTTGPTGLWITIDRNVGADALARFSTDFAGLNSVRDIRVSIFSKTTGNDPKIKYYDTNSNFAWDPGEPVIYDTNNDRYYQTASDLIIDTPPPGTALKTDVAIKFVDVNSNGLRDPSEAVVYDSNSNGVYDILEPVIFERTPSPGASLTSDPLLKFYDVNGSNLWGVGEPVVSDANSNDTYDSGEPAIDGPIPQSILQDDPRTRFIDSNSNGVFNSGETVIFDPNNNGFFDSGEPTIGGATPPIGTRFLQMANAKFDRIELYSATGNFEWMKNVGFETGSLSGWGAYGGGFQATNLRALSGLYSARGIATGGTIEVTQSLDGQPKVETWSVFKASAYISEMTGSSAQDYVDIWLGLVDSSPNASPAFIHYLAITGDSTIPSNSPSSIYRAINGFGATSRWLNVSAALSIETADFSTILYTPPFHLLVVGVQVSAQGLSQTTAYFDSFSLFGPYHPGPFTQGTASSYRYAADATNSTYVYTAAGIPHGAFFIVVPSGQSVLNITAPEGPVVPQNEYTKTAMPTGLRIDIPISTGFNHSPIGDWTFYTNSKNAISTVYTEDIVLRTPSDNLNPGSVANLVSQSRDPFGSPITGGDVTLTVWNSSSASVLTRTGTTDAQGWFNSTVTLPSIQGAYTLQATVNSTYVGLMTYQFSLGPRPPSADFAFTAGPLFPGDTVTFTATVSYGEPPYSFSWDFGDSSPAGSGNPASHSYSATGSYVVTLEVTDSNSNPTTRSHIVVIVTPAPLQADFTYSPASPTAGSTVDFTATSSGGRGPYAFQWSLGDQTSLTGSTVSHIYSAGGSYNVVLTVSDARATATTVSRTIIVQDVFTLSLSTSTDQASAGSPVIISGQITPQKPGVNVTLSYKVAGDAAWTVLGTAQTGDDGKFSYTWTPSQGDYELKASVGDLYAAPRESNRGQLIVSGSTQFSFLALASIAALLVAGGIVIATLLIRRQKKAQSPRNEPAPAK